MPDVAAVSSRLGRLRNALALCLAAVVLSLALAGPVAGSQPGNAYRQTNLVSDLPG